MEGRQILEVGVGTGKNIPFYPEDAHVIAVDLSPGMLRHARTLADHTGAEVDLREMDVQRLAFPDNDFDSVVTTFVFCSVPDPVKGFEEILRVLRLAGRGVFLKHVLSCTPVVRQAMRTAESAGATHDGRQHRPADPHEHRSGGPNGGIEDRSLARHRQALRCAGLGGCCPA